MTIAHDSGCHCLACTLDALSKRGMAAAMSPADLASYKLTAGIVDELSAMTPSDALAHKRAWQAIAKGFSSASMVGTQIVAQAHQQPDPPVTNLIPPDADERTWQDLYEENERLTAERDAAAETARNMLAKVVELSGRCLSLELPSFDVLGAEGGEVPANPVRARVDSVIKDLTDREVMPGDRKRLGDALDAANKPLTGKRGADEAVGNIFRKPL